MVYIIFYNYIFDYPFYLDFKCFNCILSVVIIPDVRNQNTATIINNKDNKILWVMTVDYYKYYSIFIWI